MSCLENELTKQILEDAKRGELWLYDDLNDETGFYLIHALKKQNKDANCSHIHININSPGGQTKYLFPIIDLMEIIRPDVVCTVDHIAGSGAAIILACGSKRMALENAAIMVHGISYGTGTSPQKLPFHESYLQMVKAKEEKVCRILAKKTNKPYSYWDKIFKTNEDKWFDAEEALEVGLIDEIIK